MSFNFAGARGEGESGGLFFLHWAWSGIGRDAATAALVVVMTRATRATFLLNGVLLFTNEVNYFNLTTAVCVSGGDNARDIL